MNLYFIYNITLTWHNSSGKNNKNTESSNNIMHLIIYIYNTVVLHSNKSIIITKKNPNVLEISIKFNYNFKSRIPIVLIYCD